MDKYCDIVAITMELFEDKSFEFQIAVCIDRLREKFDKLDYFDAHEIVVSCMRDISEKEKENE